MDDVLARIRQFRDARDWLQFHNPKDLAVSISIEAAELLEEFQWKSADESRRHAAENRERVADEIADVAIYLLELTDVLGIDLAAAIHSKLDKNEKKYPVEKSRGNSKKYNEL
jgi:NTP pyrophosphatase (non-canonical NTP hydrolase)